MQLITKLKSTNIKRYKFCYDLLMSILAMSVIALLILQKKLTWTDDQLQLINQANYIIWLIFVLDYIIRFTIAKEKLLFMRSNIIDLISILPFDMLFQGLRASKLLRIIYMLRVFAYLNRLYKRLNAIITTNDFHHVLWFTFTTIFSGAIAISYIDDMDIGDALWWSFVTTTTVGYGDIAPTSIGGRIVAVILMIIGIGFLSMLTGTIATFFINKKSTVSYYNETIKHIQNKLDHFDSLTIDDLNNIHSVLIVLKNNQIKK